MMNDTWLVACEVSNPEKGRVGYRPSHSYVWRSMYSSNVCPKYSNTPLGLGGVRECMPKVR